ncbi:MAG: DUF3139 domain-containing protein [Clostridia bacterium]|nr:DUF3139 domain-containing protein [Clostridia bacterium]
MKKKIIFISVAVFSVICIATAVGFVLNEVVGNPVSKILVKRSVCEYLEENYSDTDFIIEKVGYDFKNMEYYAKIVSAESPDEFFYINTDSTGDNIDDNYDLYFDDNGVYDIGSQSGEEKFFIDTSNDFDYDGPFGITTNPGECADKFFVYDKGLEAISEKKSALFGITYTNEEGNSSETVAVVSAGYDAQYSESTVNPVETKIIASNENCVIFEIRYPPVGNPCSYYYNVKTKALIELQDDCESYSGHKWYASDDMFICTTMALAVGTKMDLYAYNWDGDLLYARKGVLSGYTVSDGWLYFSTEAIENEKEKRCTVFKMKPDGTEEREYYSVSVPISTDFAVSDDTIVWWENGEHITLNLFTLEKKTN